MSDLNKEALDVWGALKPMIDQEISSRTQGMVQRRKAKVTTAPSLATNTIGVTEAFGDEMFLPFVSNMISAKVGDFVWIEWMYGATNAFVSSYAAVDDKNVSVAGVLDVVQRRCDAVLNSAGWYRILRYDAPSSDAASGVLPFEIEFFIGRVTNTTTNELHKVTLFAVQNYLSFNNEFSRSQTFSIDKVRAMVSGSTLYVDIHYAGNSPNVVYVDFSVHCWWEYMKLFAPVAFESVADSPSGETIFATYDFHANGDYTNTDLTVDGVLDVVPRRCFAALASQGWYRVLKLEGQNFAMGGTAFEIDLVIAREYWSTSNEIHSIKFQCVANQYIFSNESSASNSVLVDKIRYVRETNNVGYIDIHYTTSASNAMYVGFTVHNSWQDCFVAMGLASAPDSPSALTIREYSFHFNSSPLNYTTATTVPLTLTDYGTLKLSFNADYYDLGHIAIVVVNPSESALLNLSFSTLLQVEGLPIDPISACGFVRSLGSDQDGMDTWQLSNRKIYLRKRGGGNLLGTFGANPILQVTIVGTK